MNSPAGNRLRIGAFCVDASLDEVSTGGTSTKLEPRTMRVLQFLASRPGEVVSIEELLSQVWDDVVVTPDSVYQTVAALRRALGDDPKAPCYIANVPRRGYRLVASVAPWDESAPMPSALRPWLWLPGATVVLAIVIALIYVRFEKPSIRTPAAGETHAVPPDARSIAVLPFVDMSETKDQEYFADGLSEELINHLSHNANLKVIARTSAFQFKGKSEDMRTIATKLGVANLLEGSVRKAGNDLRITVQLIRASDGVHLWSQTYERKLGAIFEVQDDISTTVAKALNVALSARARPAGYGTSDVETYNLMLQGDYFFYRGSKGDNARAVDFYQRATTLDSENALAWAKLSGAYVWRGAEGEIPIDEAKLKAQDGLRRALAIDPDLAKAHYVLGNMHRLLDFDRDAATLEFERAIALDAFGDDAAYARQNMAMIAASKTGRADGLVAVFGQDVIRNPLNTNNLFNLAFFQFLARTPDQSAATYRRLFDLNSAYASAQANYGLVLLSMERPAEALAAAEKELDEVAKLRALSCIYWATDRRTESDVALRTFKEKFGGSAAYFVAEAHACRGELRATMDWLERAQRQRDSYLELVKIDPVLRPLHDDPRFHALLRKMRLPE